MIVGLLLLAGFAALVAVAMPIFAAVVGALVLVVLICRYRSWSRQQHCAEHGHDWRQEGCRQVCAHCATDGAPCHDVDIRTCACRQCQQAVHRFEEEWEIIGGDWTSSGAGQTWYRITARCARCGTETQRETVGP